MDETKDGNNIYNENKTEKISSISSESDINNNNIRVFPNQPRNSLLNNISDPPFLNLNENAESEENLLGRKRDNNEPDEPSQMNNSNVINFNNQAINFAQQFINSEINRNFIGNDSSNINNTFSPYLAPEIEMIIEQYTEHEDDEDNSRDYNDSLNYTESENNIINTDNNNNNNN